MTWAYHKVKIGVLGISLGGKGNWSEKVNALCDVLKVSAPKSSAIPAYTFNGTYWCENGYWHSSTWKHSPSIEVLKIKLPTVKGS